LVGLPRDPGRLEHVDEVARGALVVLRRGVVVEDVEVRCGLEPEVVGQARVVTRTEPAAGAVAVGDTGRAVVRALGTDGRVVVLLRVRGDGQQRAVDVRG